MGCYTYYTKTSCNDCDERSFLGILREMKYTYREGVQKQKGWQWIAAPLVLMVVFIYGLFNIFAPTIYYVTEPADRTARSLVATPPSPSKNRLYVPKINLTVDIVPVQVSEALSLEQGAIQRAVASGNPKDGGTYVLTAQRFAFDPIPKQTYEKSVFYHLGKLNKNDDIYIDYAGDRYAYKVLDRKKVATRIDDLETRSSEHQLTLYPSDGSGMNDEREVVTAKLTGKVVWINGQPKLESL